MKTLKWILGTLAILITGTVFFLYMKGDSIAEEIFKEKLIEIYNNDPKTKYFINLDNVKFNIFNGSVDLIGVTVSPKDSLITYQKNMENVAYTNTSIKIFIGKISLKNFNYREAISNRKIQMDKFHIQNPQVRIYQHKDIEIKEQEKQDTVDFKSIFLVSFDTFIIKELVIEDAYTAFSEISGKKDTTDIFSISNINYHIMELRAHEKSLSNPPFFLYESYRLVSDKLKFEIRNSGELTVDKIEFSSTTSTLELEGIHFKPDKSYKKFISHQHHRKPYINFSLQKLSLNQIDLEKWLNEKVFKANLLSITEPELVLQTDLGLPLDSTLQKKMLGKMLTDIPLQYKIDSIQVKNAHIELQITGKKGGRPGIVQFNKMNVQSGRLTNRELFLHENPLWTLDVQTQVNNTGEVNAHFVINLTDELSTTFYSVEASNLDMKKFNSVLGPVVHVDISSGELIHLKSSSILTSKEGSGTLDAHYEHFALLLKGKNEHKYIPFFLNIASGIGNGLLRNNNIPGSPHYHQGKYYFEKQPFDNFFKMVWLTTFYGLEDTFLGGSVQRKNRKAEKKAHKNEKHHKHRKESNAN